uniref:Uncharacterized protein n=1 Tax=Suricata suricatta TaxID=37032 RepID=A0A673V6Q4_SURSU
MGEKENAITDYLLVEILSPVKLDSEKSNRSVFWLSCSKRLRCLNLEFSHGFKIESCRSVPCRNSRGLPWVCFSHPVKKTEGFRPRWL